MFEADDQSAELRILEETTIFIYQKHIQITYAITVYMASVSICPYQASIDWYTRH